MKTLLTEEKNGVGWVFFNRPERRNAVNFQMMEEMETTINRWQEESSIKVLVFTGDEQTFVSGGDLAEFHQLRTEQEIYPVMFRMGQLLKSIRHFGKPTVAAVRGIALGGGCELAASCDFRVASERARFGFIQSRLGITTGWGGGSRLLEQLPRSKALYLLLSGEHVDADQLFQWGWIYQLFSEAHFLDSVQSFAESISQAPVEVLKAYMDIADHRKKEESNEALEARHCAQLWETEEHRRAVNEFFSRSSKTK
ncbi:enoyl-CoA hydratase/isomerase family protein [Melghirimyces algeriensis]|uniref:Enoyl-CoA hydratase/carnithine racemase n=1 Tax=Melghirimyces algeriensis TaxID=910412 RepID=A0A521BPF3_9BACL|nr:enoyl-CoA hydratase/isomerase family protein [Melghirimyces algeriensis]SMO48440.1 Enoyl-CoA hydratase/carnithine racemase [Melghirimyces algeriensis]